MLGECSHAHKGWPSDPSPPLTVPMQVCVLLSGGKDSVFAAMQCLASGHTIAAFANLHPMAGASDELDSFCFQTVGHDVLAEYTALTGIPIFRRPFQGIAMKDSLQYTETEGDEVEDLFALLQQVQQALPAVNAVCSGAIASNYQRLRVENVAKRMQWTSLAPLWMRDPWEYMEELMELPQWECVLVKCAAYGLDPSKNVGKPLNAIMLEKIRRLTSRIPDLSPAGEGGEYESLVLESPIFGGQKISLDQTLVCVENEYLGRLQVQSFSIVESTTTTAAPSPEDCWKGTCRRKQRVRAESRTQAVWETNCWKSIASSSSSSSSSSLDVRALDRFPSFQLLHGHSLAEISAACALQQTILLHVWIELEDMNPVSFAAMNVEYEAWLKANPDCCCYGPSSCYPSRSTVGVRGVGAGKSAEALLSSCSYSVTALTCPRLHSHSHSHSHDSSQSSSNTVSPTMRMRMDNLHVQSLSEWSMPCLGPYSQLVGLTVEDEEQEQGCPNPPLSLYFLAGMIGIDPWTLEMDLEVAVKTELALVCRHVQSCLDAVRGSEWSGVVVGIILYVREGALSEADVAEVQTLLVSHFKLQSPQVIRCVTVAALPKNARIELGIVGGISHNEVNWEGFENLPLPYAN